MKVLKFSASWCQPCKTLTTQLESLAANYEEIDADTDPDKFKAFGIRNVPTLVLLDNNGIEKDRLTGSVTLPKLKAFLNPED